MAKTSYPSTSPYSATEQTSWYLKNWAFRSIPADGTDTIVVLGSRHKNRPDILSQEQYGTPAYYWVFAIRNPWLRADPIWAFTEGARVIVPSMAHIGRTIGA